MIGLTIFVIWGRQIDTSHRRSYMNWGVLLGCTRIVAELNSYSIDFHASIILSCVLIGNYVSAHMKCGLEKTNNAMNGDREKKPRQTKMGERHHRYVRYDENSK